MAAKKKNIEPAATNEVRAWARENGFTVGDKGKLKAEVKEAFTKATKRPVA